MELPPLAGSAAVPRRRRSLGRSGSGRLLSSDGWRSWTGEMADVVDQLPVVSMHSTWSTRRMAALPRRFQSANRMEGVFSFLNRAYAAWHYV